MEKHSSTGGTSGIGAENTDGSSPSVAVVAWMVSAGPPASLRVTSAWARVRPAGPAATVRVAGPAAGARR
jgi:hypothetical protein